MHFKYLTHAKGARSPADAEVNNVMPFSKEISIIGIPIIVANDCAKHWLLYKEKSRNNYSTNDTNQNCINVETFFSFSRRREVWSFK
ncbi:hypothetical protein Bpfe_024508 [Biomphalaria pfeifferi]|uniref:Uncharacterized protein n=1 Tax=Biomphalaria pfeifferi TaxID=112525 RepID=A0AAD8B0Y6_BIOPF|nr:hypothetical protein Bpfe_024508 [Biomphalaria pfeifferi]